MRTTLRSYKVGDECIIERLVYPRFRANIDCERPVKELTNISFQDQCSPEVIAKAIKEASSYLKRFLR